ncbi:matrixin family metalloprotease [Persicimonas caeni]|uniref:Matrixin family metalloprotease n=1 Tax=Persicimonas caeni TaxID=2292766 RepID=A0A4Y6PQ73_PERCE|nr:matrixin family metalloprotease [Persicimonas caeni]QDG50468.1 matrixin family metalloprotease [Persicimonas caeni]QED31689.1 matrixin family metalloprotease [Persicimonas caeni]
MKSTHLCLICALLLLPTACGEAQDAQPAETETDDDFGGKGDWWGNTGETPSFEEFAEQIYCEPDTDVCIVEGDLPIAGGRDGLRAYYEARVVGSRSALSVQHEDGVDARWPRAQRFELTYCVSDAFGDRKAEVIEAMAGAAAAWQEHAHAEFRHVPEADADCDMGTDRVLFPVLTPPSADAPYFARAFFPNYETKERQVRINVASMDDALTGNDELAQNLTLEGVLRHELGHVLGFRHEHTRPEANYSWCFEDDNYRPITGYDASSVMHYPQCNGEGDWSLTLTETDKEGAAFFYPDYEKLARCDEELDADGHVREDCVPVEHQIVELANTASAEILDDWARLDTRAVDDILAHRDRQPFHTLADLKAMRYLEEQGVRKLYDYLYVDGRCPEELDADGRVLASCQPVANRILELANTASFETLDEAVSLDRRAAENIVAAREQQPFDELGGLWLVDYVKTRAMRKMYDYLYGE